MTSEDIEELKRFPRLWRQYQEGLAEGRVEGARQQRRASIMTTIVARFDPPASEYLRIEPILAAIDDDARLESLFQRALRARELAEVVAAIGEGQA